MKPAGEHRLFDPERPAGECPHCDRTPEEECPWTRDRTGLDRLPYPDGCHDRPDPATMPIPY